jgi:DNA-binding MarR family transcriptional regulator
MRATMAQSGEEVISKAVFEKLAEFRYQLRRFERFSEKAVRAHKVTPLQYLLLLHIKGFPGREYANVRELAERLQAQPHGVVALISRCEAAGLVARRPSERDGREVEVHLLKTGVSLLTKLASMHRAELKSIKGVFPVPLGAD